MASCATLYQCFNFLARNDAVLSLTKHPTDPAKYRLVIRTSDSQVLIEYDCTEEMDFLTKVLSPVCRTLDAHLEKVAREKESPNA